MNKKGKYMKMQELTSLIPSREQSTLDALINATGNFLQEIAAKAAREQPAVHAIMEAALHSEESFTNINIKIFPSGIRIRATISRISDGEEQLVLDQFDGVARVLQ